MALLSTTTSLRFVCCSLRYRALPAVSVHSNLRRMSSSPVDRWIRFVAVEDGETYYGVPHLPADADIGELHHNSTPFQAHTLTSSPLLPPTSLTSPLKLLTVSTLLSPLSPSEIPIIRATGGQYAGQHKGIKPEFPFLFFKPARAVIGPEEDIKLPKAAKGGETLFEVELAVVIGKEAKNVGVEEALEYVNGYTVVNDLTARGLIGKGGLAWAKALDTFLPLGPVVVSNNALRDPHQLALSCTVNGVLVQEASTSEMLSSVAELVSKLSQGTTLEVGSIICTGSPTPLQNVVGANLWLEHGDIVKCYVEGIGSLYNRVVDKSLV